MEQRDLDLIAQYANDNPELAQLYDEHRQLDAQLQKMDRKPFLTEEEKLQQAAMKKQKLAGRDAMESVLQQYRTRVRTHAHKS